MIESSTLHTAGSTPGSGPLSPFDLYYMRDRVPVLSSAVARPVPLSVLPSRPATAPRVDIPAGVIGALGKITKFAATGIESPDFRVSERYDLQNVARDLLPSHRVSSCHRHHLPDRSIEVLYTPGRGAHYAGLMRCGSVWVCPVCAAKIAQKRKVELDKAVTAWAAAGKSVYLLSLTFQHNLGSDLRVVLDALLKAYRALTAHRRYKGIKAKYLLQHTVRALEVTYSDRNGWHPHLHALLFSDVPLVDDSAGAAELEHALGDEVFVAWLAELEKVGLSCNRRAGVHVKVTRGAIGDYVAKFGVEPAKLASPWGVADELTKSHVKQSRSAGGLTPFDLLRWLAWDNSNEPADLFAEYVNVFHGRSQLTWSRGARVALGLGVEKSDVELVEETEADAVLVGDVSPAEWKAVLFFDARAQLLRVGSRNDPAELREFLGSLVLASGVSVEVEARRERIQVRRR